MATKKKEPEGHIEPELALQLQLDYLHNFCLKHALAITQKLKSDEASGAELARHYESMVKGREQLIKVSSALLPYRKPKLESIEVKQEVEHRFVVVSPTPIKSHEEFLNKIAAPNKQPLIVGSTNKPMNILDIQNPEVKLDPDIQSRFLDIPKDIKETPEDKRRMYLEE